MYVQYKITDFIKKRLKGSQEDLFDDRIEDILENITLKRPVNAFTYYSKEEYKKIKNSGKTLIFCQHVKNCSLTWAKLAKKEKDN